ncbi:hypothetical protein [Gordonia alkanivorans]|uniref:hypothetical protein n=1 Tax=Gordonia alkanivorans TaxID=84096 RepID=UPI0024B704ED|nr:hypothetical protein [Gordonia alkanivorans]MDJ0010102.1 hypothetical protein [Gordonia alkanivorans]MDJ0495708.1 hypothetical protein [Gordonia alkanivorans]
MAKIRDDLEGVVYVANVVLKAGDTIPDGVEVGDHLTATTTSKSSGSSSKGGRTRRASSNDE